MAITHLTIMAIFPIMAIMAIMACHIMAVNMAKLYVYWKSITNEDGLWREYLNYFTLYKDMADTIFGHNFLCIFFKIPL